MAVSALLRAIERLLNAPKPPRPPVSDADVVQNAATAAADIRASIDHQVRTANGLDTKAVATLTVIAAVAAFVAPRFHMDTEPQRWAGTFTFGVVSATVAFVLWSLRPRDFSYGVHPDDLLASVERYDRAGYAIGHVKGLRSAYHANDRTLDARLRWYLASLVGLAALVAGLGAMLLVGAIQSG